MRTDRLAGEILAGVDHQRQWRAQVVFADVGYRHVIRHGTGGTVHTGGSETDTDMVREIEQSGEVGLIDLLEAKALVTLQTGGNAQGVVVSIQAIKGKEGGAALRVVTDRADQDRLTVATDHRIVVGVEHRVEIVASADKHVVVEHHADAAHRQWNYGAIHRAGGDDPGRNQRRDDVDLMSLANQQAAVPHGIQGFAARTATRDADAVQGGQVNHHQFAAGASRRHIVGDEQQAGELRAGQAEGEGIDLGIQAHLGLDTAAIVEGHHVAAIRPQGAPQLPVGGIEGQIVDAHVAEMTEGMQDRVEDFDTATRRDIELAGGRIQRDGLRDAVAITAQNRARFQVNLDQGVATGGCPQLTVGIEGQVKDRVFEFEERL